MRVIKLESMLDNDSGELGLALVDMPKDDGTNAATDGLLMAHDIMEHVNGPKKIGTIDDELEALGAIWYVRGQHGQLTRNGYGMYTIAENVSSDITRMFRDYMNGAYVNIETLRTHAVLHDSDLQETLIAADKTYQAEFYGDNSDEFSAAKQAWPAYRALCLHRMRVGYRKAWRKWEKHGKYAANSQFWAIAEAIDRTIKHEMYSEGQRFILRYGNGEATCTPDYDDNY